MNGEVGGVGVAWIDTVGEFEMETVTWVRPHRCRHATQTIVLAAVDLPSM